MARMLGRYLTGGCSSAGKPCLPPGPDCVGREPDPRRFKRREQRAVRREVDAYPDDLSEGAERRIAQYAWETGDDALYDWSDCRHGCNGDCVTGGASERCTFVCHGGVCDVDHERAVEYISRFADSN